MKYIWILGLVALTSCGTKPEVTPSKTAVEVPILNAGRVEAFATAPSVSSTASFVAIEASEIGPETEGVVREVFVRVGDAVPAGQALLRLESRDAQLRLDEAQARVKEMQAALAQAQARLGGEGERNLDLSAEVLSAQSNLDNAEEEVRLATIEETRAQRLRGTKDISQSSYDRSRSTLLSAQARLRGAQQQLAAAKNGARQSSQGIAIARAQLEMAQAQAAQAQKRLGDTQLRAPFAGVVTARNVAAGEFLSPQSKPLRVEKTDPLKLVFQLPETQAAQVTAGMAVEALVAALPGEVFTGKLRTPNASLESSSRALTVEAEFPNPQRKLKPGYFADARILLRGEEMRLRVPAAALDFDPRTETYKVWSHSAGKIKLHLVGVPQKAGASAELKNNAGGLQAGMAVIVNPPANLYDGMSATLATSLPAKKGN
jgi:HlyD family secretion protein